MTSEREVKEFLEIESLASKVAQELTALKKEAENHVTVSQSFSTALTRIESLSESAGKGADQLAVLCQSMREGVLPEILQKTDQTREQIFAIRKFIIAGVVSVAVLQVINILVTVIQ